MENNINSQIDNTFEAIKAEIAQEVGTILASKGIEIIDNSYDAGREVVKLIQTYNESMDKINIEIDRNNDTYREDKAKVLNYNLNLDKQDLKRDTLNKLDKVLEKQQLLYQQQVRDKQSDPNYVQAKGEMLNVVSLLSRCDNIPVEQLMEVINPAIETSDLRTLGIVHTLLQSNKVGQYAVERAMDGIRDIEANGGLHDMVQTMRDYIETENDGLGYYAWLHKYL